jgi:hypothetical protein
MEKRLDLELQEGGQEISQTGHEDNDEGLVIVSFYR